jgi:hypothetical protein
MMYVSQRTSQMPSIHFRIVKDQCFPSGKPSLFKDITPSPGTPSNDAQREHDVAKKAQKYRPGTGLTQNAAEPESLPVHA